MHSEGENSHGEQYRRLLFWSHAIHWQTGQVDSSLHFIALSDGDWC